MFQVLRFFIWISVLDLYSSTNIGNSGRHYPERKNRKRVDLEERGTSLSDFSIFVSSRYQDEPNWDKPINKTVSVTRTDIYLIY